MAQVDAAQIDVAHVDAAQIDMAQVNATQIDVAQADGAQINVVQTQTEANISVEQMSSFGTCDEKPKNGT